MSTSDMSPRGKFVQIAGDGMGRIYALDEWGYVWCLTRDQWERETFKQHVPEESK